MDSNNARISARQLRRFIISSVVGLGILTLPRELVEIAGPDGWMVLILSGGLSIVLAMIIYYLGKQFPKQTIIGYSRDLIGRPGAIVIGIVGVIYYVIFASFGVRIFGEILKMYLLPRTPIEVITITFLFSILYLVRGGLETLARFYEFIFWFMLLPFFFALIAGIQDTDLTNLLPMLQTSPRTLFRGSFQVLFSFIGFEAIFLYMPFVSDKENIKKSLIWSIVVITSIYLFSSWLVLSSFGVSEIEDLIWPLMSYIKSVEVPGGFIEQLEGIIMTVWVLFIYTTLSTLYFSASFILGRLTKTNGHKIFALFLLPIIYVLSLLPDNIAQLYDWLGMFSLIAGTIMIILIPLLLLIVTIVRRKGVKDSG